MTAFDPHRSALLLVDLQNDFLDPRGAYGRNGHANRDIAAVPARLKPLANCFRARGGLVAATLFTLVPGRGGAPLISPHLRSLRPFLTVGDFAPGSWGQDIVDALKPVDVTVEKIAYSAFFNTRLEWVLRRCDIETLIVGGIVTNGGVASTVRDAHVRDFSVRVLSDGCAAFSPETHAVTMASLAAVVPTLTCQEAVALFDGEQAP